ncbi:DUF485 domain-containing protein [Corynebacterium otitidis]|uniref:Putative membrane protein n=1 Tax=Corynebacterium otitidis ATCC 51513 TaxID=883169 RepID=I7JVM0_9CORY|nr:DUF485 domain-containing protein [Corynebacterium otitidis]EJZ82866.1 hypothetical protein HMPREF9719_00189 [Corynebacterium otitidis ATCC 51513]CCI83071.1 putative membrane protein [Corynebacterium otitidis ATCC 51513]
MTVSYSDVSPPAVDYVAIQHSPEFRRLRSTIKSFTFPVTALGLVWFYGYSILAIYRPDLYAVSVFGYVNVGIVLGLAQFATTFLITWAYMRFANRRVEPQQAAIRAQVAGEAR